jgi:hypothetical protein
MPELHETLMGRKLIEGTLPDIADQLKRIADALEDKEIRTENAITNLITQFPNDADLGKEIRKRWQKK